MPKNRTIQKSHVAQPLISIYFGLLRHKVSIQGLTSLVIDYEYDFAGRWGCNTLPSIAI